MDKAYLWESQLALLLFPQRECICCGGFMLNGICEPCRKQLAALRPCANCATFVRPTETEHYRCHDCRGRDLGFDQARAAAVYEGRIRAQLLRFKYDPSGVGLRRGLTGLLLEAFDRYYAELTFDAVLPVPLHPRREEERQYNQAELLAYTLGQKRDIKEKTDWLTRVKDTPPLSGTKNAKERFELMRGTFTASGQVQGKRLLLIDDIFTSGATADAASQALKKKGAASVHVLTVAAGRDL